MTHLERYFPAFLILASFVLVAVFPTFPTVLLALGALAFYALNAANYTRFSALNMKMESLCVEANQVDAEIDELRTRATALEKTTEKLPELQNAVIQIKNRTGGLR